MRGSTSVQRCNNSHLRVDAVSSASATRPAKARSAAISTDDAAARELIRVAVESLIDRPGLLLDGGLRVEVAVNEAKTSQATFYRKFGGKSTFLDHVRDRLVAIAYQLPHDVTAYAREAVEAQGGDRRRAVRSLVEKSFDVVFDPRSATTRLLAGTLGPATPRTALALRDGYRRSDAAVIDLFDALFARTGATLRKPFTANGLSVAVTALIEGFAMRRAADPSAVTAELVSDTILAVIGAAVDSKQRHQHIDDALTVFAEPTHATMPDEPRTALITAARAEFGKRGYFGASLEQIAVESGVPIDAARRFYPTKAHLIVGALAPEYAKLRQGIADDLLVEYDVVTVIEHHLTRCGRLVARERAYMDALMAAVAHDTYAEPDGMLSVKEDLNLPALLVPVIAQGQHSGEFIDTEESLHLANFITNSMLLRCFTRRNEPPENNAAFVASVMLNGIRKS